VKEGVRTVKETVRQVGSQMRGAGQEFRQTIDSLAARGADQACTQVGAAASALRHAADDLEDSQPGVARLTHNVAGRLERVTDYLHERRPIEIVHDIENFARREPLLFLGGAVLVGALIGRVIKASSARPRGYGTDQGRYDDDEWRGSNHPPEQGRPGVLPGEGGGPPLFSGGPMGPGGSPIDIGGVP
jgi:hypothetical protein